MNFDDHVYDVDKNDYVKRTEPKDNGKGKMKFKVYESASMIRIYEVEAETEDDARDIVEEGDAEAVRTEYIDREIYQITESHDE